MNAVVYLLPENHTDKVQHIDAGYRKRTKIGEAMEGWLEEDNNLELCMHDKILSAKMKRILMTK